MVDNLNFKVVNGTRDVSGTYDRVIREDCLKYKAEVMDDNALIG